MKKLIFLGLLIAGFGSPMQAAAPALSPSTAAQNVSPAHPRTVHVRNDLASAQRALSAAKIFLAKAPNDPAGHRAKAFQAVENALAEVTAALAQKTVK